MIARAVRLPCLALLTLGFLLSCESLPSIVRILSGETTAGGAQAAGGTQATGGAQAAGGAQPTSGQPATAASQPAGAPTRSLPEELKAALLPLFVQGTAYSPPSYPVENLPADVDPVSAVALHRLNEYRAAAGLPPYRYDPGLTSMASAHVKYAMTRSREKKPCDGYFEVPGDPGYSKEGNEAASTSGVAYGDADALEVLEGLVAGPYHRIQFL